MKQDTPQPESASTPTWETLEAFARSQVQRFVQALLEEEITALLGRARSQRRAAVDAPAGSRNGYGTPRRLAMQTGTITVRRPRVRGLAGRVESRILPLFARRTRAVGALLPELSLHGLAQGDFELALRGLLGEGAPLSASSIARLKAGWQLEHDTWRQQRLEDRELVYLWADGVYLKAELEKAAVLVVIGAMRDGRKEVLAVTPGYRESTESWTTVFRNLRDRGLGAPKLLVADGNAGTWAAAAAIWPETAEQRCWNHTLVNVLDQRPKTVHGEARALLCAIPYAPTQAEAERQRDAFARRYQARYPQAVAILETDWDRMVAFYRFPEPHWKHLRTTDESVKRKPPGAAEAGPFHVASAEAAPGGSRGPVPRQGTGDGTGDPDRSAGHEAARPAAPVARRRRQERASVVAPVPLAFGRFGCQWATSSW